MLQRIILGPQRPTINVPEAVSLANIPDGPVAVISAGWQEGEGELDELSQLVRRPLVALNLYTRAEQLFAADGKFRAAYRQRQDRLQQLQHLYRIRLRQLMLAARQLRREKISRDLLEIEQRHAILQVRALDEHLLNRIEAIYEEYSEALSEKGNALLAEYSFDIKAKLGDCSTVLIPGGNVLVLLNRMQLFTMSESLASRHLIAWSAGAMVLSDLIVLYHDRTPLGRRNPEVLGAGLGIVPGQLFLPDAAKRLQVKDLRRMSIFSERFAPAKCVTLDSGSLVRFENEKLCQASSAGWINSQGRIEMLDVE